jgi:hypothetical protein
MSPTCATHGTSPCAAIFHVQPRQQLDQGRAGVADAAIALDPLPDTCGGPRQRLRDPRLQCLLLDRRQFAGAALVAEIRQPIEPFLAV